MSEQETVTIPTEQDIQIGQYTVPSHKVSPIILSIHKQFVEKGQLSDKQWYLIRNIIGEVEQLLPYELQTIPLVKVHFYRYDSNGDALADYEIKYVDNCNFSEEITNKCSAQYNYSDTTLKYTPYKDIEVLSSLTTEREINKFLQYAQDFHELIAKIGRNRFKTLKNKNATIRVVNKLIKGAYVDIETELDQVTGREFKRNLYKRGY
jgi:hypothetical protein